MAKNKKAQDGTALPRSLDPKVKAAVAADKQRTKQGRVKSTEPFKPKDTRHWQSDSRAKERINSYEADIALQTAIDQVPYAPYALAAMAFNQGRPLTALSELIKLPGGWPIDAVINVTQENPAGIDIKTFEDKTIPYARLSANALFENPIITQIGKQRVESGKKKGSKWYDFTAYELPALYDAAKSYGVDDNTFTQFIEDNWESSGGSYKKVLDAAKKQFSKKQQGGSVESRMGGLTDQGFNYNGAWGGTMQMGGNLPGAVGFTYARTGSIPSNGKYAKKTKASAEEGMEILPDPTDPDRKYKLSATIASAKDILNPLLRAKDPAKYDAWTKGRVAALREKGMPAMREYMEQNPISIYLSPQEVKTALSKQREGFYEDYIGAIRGLRDYESEIGTPMRETLYGGKEGQGELENLNYGWRFATLPVNLSKQTTTTSGKPIPEESFMYSYDPTKDEYKKTPYYENGGKMMSYYQAGLDFQPKTISKKGSKIKKDDAGYWNPENWGEPVEIDSNEITMEGVYQPLIGVSDTGDVQYMEPGENYTFDGESVTEYPVMQKGGRTVSIVDYLKSVKLDSSKAARKKLAQEFGIQNYDYSSKKNLELLKALTSGNSASAQPKTLAKGVVDLMIPKAYFNPKVSSPNMKLQQISNTGGHPNTLAPGVVDIIVPQYRTAPKVGNKKPSLRSISTTSSRPAPIVEEPNPFIEGISELYNNSVDYLSGLASGIQRKYEQMQDEDVSSIVKKPVAPTDPTKYGYQELYAVPDVGGERGDSLVAFTNTFDNSQGGRYYVGNKVKEVTDTNARRRFENTHGVGHFLRDSDILPNQKITPESWNTVKGYTFHTTSPGKTVSAGRFNNPSWYRMLYRRDPNDQDPNAYSIKYMQNKDVSKIQDQLKKEGWNLDYTVSGQHRFSDLDWNKEGPSTGYASKSKWIPLKNSDENSYIPYKNKDGFSRFSGGSGVYVFKDPKMNKEIGVDVAGSVNTLRQVGEELINSYNLKPEDLTLVYHDMGSYSAKPKSKEGILDYNQWLNFNTYNKGFSGAPLIIRKKEGGVVTKYPVARKGVSVNKADEAPLKKLDQLLNFTNYNDMKKAKKGKNIPKAQMGMSGFGNPAFTSAIQGAVDFQGGYNDYISSVDKKGKGAGMSQFSMPGSLGASPLAKDIEFLGMAKQALKERKKAKQSLAVSEVVKQAATMRPDIQKRKYVRPEDNLLQPDQMGMMPYGGGYDVLGMAENGMQIGGNLTEIQNMYNPGTLYDNLGYEPLDESSKVKQFKKGGGIPKAQTGMEVQAAMELLSLGQGLRNQAILGAINRKTNKWTEQATQNLQQGAMNQALQTQFSPFMKDGGSLDVSDEYKWVSHSWQPQVITKFGEHNVKDLLKPDPMMDTLRTGGNIRSNYMGDDEMVRSMAMGGNLQTHWGGEGEVMSYNPYMPGSGETVMLKGNSHEESDGQGNTGVGMSYSGNMVEAERGEPVVEMQEGGAVGDTSAVVFGNMKIPSYGISELQDSKAKGKKFKSYAADLAKKEQKQSKIVDKATKMIDNIEGDSPYDMLKMNAAQAMIMGADMSLKDLANKKKTLAGVQNAILDTAEEMGLESDALAKGKIMQAKKGTKLPKGQAGIGVLKDYQNPPVDISPSARFSGYFPYTPAYKGKLEGEIAPPSFAVDLEKTPFEYTPQGLPESGLTAEDYLRYGVQPEAPSFKSEYYSTPEGKKIENEKKAGNKIKDFLSQNEGLFSALYNEALPYLRPSNQMQLQPEQLAGEMFALSTNVLQGVPAQTYQPLLETRAPQMSAQEQLNQNQADFNAMLRQVGNNPAALGILAAQKQAADRQAIAQTQAYNTQQAIAANNRNIAMLNDASLKNLGILDTQYQRQEGAKANTKAQAQAALSSIASKIGQNKLENLSSAVMQNMYNFRFGPKGRIINYNPLAQFNVPDIMAMSDEKAAELQKALDKRKGKTEEARNGSIVKAIKGL